MANAFSVVTSLWLSEPGPNLNNVTSEQDDYQPPYVIPVPSVSTLRKSASKEVLCSMYTVSKLDIEMTEIYNSHLHFPTLQE